MSVDTRIPMLPPAMEGEELIAWIAEYILPRVQKPVRYIGNEPGIVLSTEQSSGDILFMFPDVYEIGVGNMGLSLLRSIVNTAHDLTAETAYCPWSDMEVCMREYGVPLYSLESYRPALSFDVIGITIQHELCYTNILTMLSLAGIPLKQSKRSSSEPYVIGGGPGSFNPEPIADFFDLIFLGEGEDVINDLVRILSRGRRDGMPREVVLREALSIEGVYVPSCYAPGPTGSDSNIPNELISEGTPGTIRIHRNAGFPDTIIERESRISLTAPTHDRLSVEIMRGCPGGCTFCQAKRFYGGMRTKSMDMVLEEIRQGVQKSGFDDVSLLGLSCSDYPAIHELLDRANRYLLPRKASLSLPSLRADSFSESISIQLSRFRRGGFTFAPEAGSDELRRQLGKNITNDQILSAIDTVLSHGGTGVKLYFMIGIPEETTDDIDAIIDLSRQAVKLVKQHRARRLTLSIAPLVPKPHTPLERSPFEDIHALESKRRKIVDSFKSSRVHVRWRSEEYSWLEAILSRGDRRLASVVEEAWRAGARFDGWENEMKIGIWKDALRIKNLDWREYLRAFSSDEVLPWSHISKSAKITTRESSKENVTIPSNSVASEDERDPGQADNVPRDRLRIRYSKRGLYRFLSHLDLMRLWSRILRKSAMEIVYTSGFSPRPKLSFGPALPVGFESEGEYLDVWLTSSETTGSKSLIADFIPDDLKPFSVRSIPLRSSSLGSLLRFAAYTVCIPKYIHMKRPESMDHIPEGIKVYRIEDTSMEFSTPLDRKGAPRPREFVRTLFSIDETDIPLVHFTRTGLWTSDDPRSRKDEFVNGHTE